jgi:hypothetical protein
LRLLGDVLSERPVSLELALAEHLIGGRLMWKRRFALAILTDQFAFIADK